MKFTLVMVSMLMAFSAMADVTCIARGLSGTAELELARDTATKSVYTLKLGTAEFVATINHNPKADEDAFLMTISDTVRGTPLWAMSKYSEVPEKGSVLLFNSGYLSALECKKN